jgi:hypothetical protein
MKKAILIVVLFFFFSIAGIALNAAFGAELMNVTYKTFRIGQSLRMVIIYADKEGLHFQYFTEPRTGEGPKPLGEEIFKNGEKIFDSYKENDSRD